MLGLAKLLLACFACLVYTSVGLIFHYFIKSDEMQYTASSIGIVFAWPFIIFSGIFIVACCISIPVVIYTIIEDKWYNKNLKKRYTANKQPENLREAVDYLMMDSAKAARFNTNKSEPPRPKRD